MTGCDTLLMVGTSFPYSEFLPEEGKARGVQIDIDGRMLGLRYPTEVNLVGDSAATLRALLPHLERKQDRSWREQVEQQMADWWRVIEERAMNEANPINPQRVFWELSPRLPNDCILTSDSGSAANWFARDLRLRRGMMASLSGNLATMGCGVPYAIAAKFAYPDRVAIALVGDGAMQMNGLAELVTVAKYWRRWTDPRLVVLVLNNRDPGHLGAAGDGGQSEVRGVAGHPRPALRSLRRDDRPEGHPRRDPGRDRPGLGGGARRRPTRRPRRRHRPRGAAAAAAHHLRGGEEVRPGRRQGRSGAAGDERAR